MEGILGRLLIEFAAIALQIGIMALIQWLRSRADAGSVQLGTLAAA